MSTWTLALDESGKFEGSFSPDGAESVARIIGGALLPEMESGRARDTLLLPWKNFCRTIGQSYPPHATDLKGADRGKLFREADRLLQSLGGSWVFLVEEPAHHEEEPLSLYGRMVSELVEIAARVASPRGCTTLDVLASERRLPLTRSAGTDLLRLGFDHAPDKNSPNTLYTTMLSSAELRQAIDLLRREETGQLGPWPALGQTALQSTRTEDLPHLHPAHLLADAACNALWTALRTGKSGSEAELLAWRNEPGAPAIVVGRGGLPLLRRIDQAMRDEPASLLRAGEALARLRALVEASDRRLSSKAAVRELTLLAATTLWQANLRQLAQGSAGQMALLGSTLASEAQLRLAQRAGNYEGLALALEAGWLGNEALPQSMQKSLLDPTLRVRLDRVSLECANHRGESSRAQSLGESIGKAVSAGPSLALLAERLDTLNLLCVAWQNELPCAEAAVADTLGLLQLAEQDLVVALEQATTACEAASPQAAPVASPAEDPWESQLRAAVGNEESWVWRRPDASRGAGWGTTARSAAFAGKLSTALEHALQARSFFGASPRDLAFNASVLARIAVEAHRLYPKKDTLLDAVHRALLPALHLAGATRLGDLATIDTREHERFALDLALRALLWAPEVALEAGLRRRAMVDSLLRNEAKASLSRLRSHPTELVARHAAELCRLEGKSADAVYYFALSLELSRQAPAGTIARFAPFTAALQTGAPATGPANSLLNPSFEYR